MDKKCIKVIKEMALEKYPYENVPSFEYEAREKRKGYVQGFLDGVEWFKKQMMEKAVEGVITFDYYGNDNKTYGCIAHDSFCLEDIGMKDTDKVKMIIVKDEMS